MQTADFTIADVLAWARTKPADEDYSFYDASCCALAQFGRATGREHLIDLGSLLGRSDLPVGLAGAVQGINDFGDLRWTFGSLVARLEALLPAESLSDTWTKADAYCPDLEILARGEVRMTTPLHYPNKGLAIAFGTVAGREPSRVSPSRPFGRPSTIAVIL